MSASSDNLESARAAKNASDLLGRARMKGVQFWRENGELRYRAPRGALTPAEIDCLRQSREAIVAALDASPGLPPRVTALTPRPHADRAPLAWSQLAHWHLYELDRRPAIRQIASAMRIRGRLILSALRAAVHAVVQRHDALRTRIVVKAGVPEQRIDASGPDQLCVEDLTALSPSVREERVHQRIGDLILEPIDVASGPLFEARLLKLSADEHVLILVMEHTISDAFSMNIVLNDIFGAYRAAARGRPPELPPVAIQFADYAHSQRRAHAAWRTAHEEYWTEHLRGCRRLPFPADRNLSAERDSGWGMVPVQIGTHQKRQLREWCALRKTTPVLGILTAYVALLSRWCAVSDLLVQHQMDGRIEPRLAHTVGYLASGLYLRIRLNERDDFLRLLERLMAEYCTAYEHADASWMESAAPQPDFTRTSAFNWIPQGRALAAANADALEEALDCTPVPFIHPMLKQLTRDNEPVLMLIDAEEAVTGGVYFPSNRFSSETMARFARNLQHFIQEMLARPQGTLQSIALCR